VANPGSYQSFFNNPAGFGKYSGFTLLSVNPWIFTDVATIGLLTEPEQTISDIENSLDDPDIQTEIDQWLNATSSEDLAAIIQDAGYTEADILAAGGPEPFFDGLTQEEIVQVIGLVLEQEDFPVKPQDLGLPSGAARVGMASGLALTRSGLGLGIFGILEAELSGQNILAAEGVVKGQITAHAGYAYTFDLELLQLHVGAQIRPTFYLQAPVGVTFISDLMSSVDVFSVISNIQAIQGYGLGIDAGIILDIWGFSFGLSAFDLFGTKLRAGSVNLGDYLMNPLMKVENGLEENVPMSMNFGVAFRPQLGSLKYMLDPTLYVDFQDINGIVSAVSAGDKYALLDLINVGADVTLFRTLKARAGYTQGYFTVGAGLDLLFLEANVAATFGTLDIENVSDFGISADIAFRF
jgi:hypothetical protein